VSLKYQNRSLITSVRDTGVGIEPEAIQKLFQFFGKLHQSKKINQGGMGFGLTISKLII